VEVQSLLSPPAGAEGLHAALRSPALRRMVRGALAGMLADPSGLGPCRLHRTKAKPGAKLTAWFHVALRDAAAGREVAVSWWEPARCPAVADDERAAEADALARGTARPFASLTTHVPSASMRIHAAPLDPAFPGLGPMSDPQHVATRLGFQKAPDVVALRYRPGQRHVLRYRDGRPTWFAKLYRDARGERHARAAAAVSRVLDGQGAVATPSTCLDDERALVFAHVRGAPLSSLLRAGAPAASPAVAGAGRLLRRMHDADPAPLGGAVERAARDELPEVERATAAIAALAPGDHRTVQDVISGTADLLAALPTEAAALCHGDFKADHVLVSRRELTLIDFDKCAPADPAIDLAKFLADLRWWLGETADATEGAQARFLEGYGPAPTERLARARALEPLFVVKLAARRIQVHQPDWQRRTSASVSRAGRLLRELARA
jgi:tRNA A-37 threonylcarbamoyl transferase component Bud32